jgi:hypothetical protein
VCLALLRLRWPPLWGQRESAEAMDQARQLIPALCELEGLVLVVPMAICSNVFIFRVTDRAAGTEAGRKRE